MRKLILIPALLSALLAGCFEPSVRSNSVDAQQRVTERALKAVPVPVVTNFLAREAVAKQVRRLDEAGKLFYVYIIGDNGQQIGYYVSNTRPVATCTLLTPPEEVLSNGYGSVVKAPGLGGTYSPAPSCAGVFFFDAATDAYIEIAGLNYFVSDQPLSVRSEPIRVAK